MHENTTDRSPTLAEIIAEREAEAVEKYRLAVDHYVNAQLAAADTQSDRDTAEDNLEEIEDSFLQLDDNFTAAEHAEATSALRRAELRSQGAHTVLSAASKALVKPDKLAAEVVAQAVVHALPGATVLTSFRDVGSLRPGPEELPLALVLQTGPSVLNENGSISGTATIRWYRSILHAQLDAELIIDASEASGVGLEVIGQVTSQLKGSQNELRVRLHEGVLGLPFISNISTFSHRSVGWTVASEIAVECKYEHESVRENRLTGAMRSSFVTTKLEGTKVVSQEIEDGTRTLVLDSAVIVRQHKPLTGRTVRSEVERILFDFGGGTFFPGLGVVSELALVSGDDTSLKLTHREMRLALADDNDLPLDAAAVGYEDLTAYYVRTTLQSTTQSPM